MRRKRKFENILYFKMRNSRQKLPWGIAYYGRYPGYGAVKHQIKMGTIKTTRAVTAQVVELTDWPKLTIDKVKV